MKKIATIKTDFAKKFGVPRQSGRISGVYGKVIFEPQYRRTEAVRGLDGYSHIWLIWEFSELADAPKNGEGWRPTVRPPRLGGNKRVGVFATRSPYRPNPIGLSSVKLIGIDLESPEAPVLIVEGADLIDGTPIYDIKPYLPSADCHPDAVGGFADDVSGYYLSVTIPEECEAKLSDEHKAAVRAILADDPRPSYQHDPDRLYGFVYAGYEIKFRVNKEALTVTDIVKL